MQIFEVSSVFLKIYYSLLHVSLPLYPYLSVKNIFWCKYLSILNPHPAIENTIYLPPATTHSQVHLRL